MDVNGTTSAVLPPNFEPFSAVGDAHWNPNWTVS
jgi:hypothetical protein